MKYVTILVSDNSASNTVQTITLNRPERRNALTPQMQEELVDALQEAAAGECRVVVLKGAGEAFCAGLDLSVLQSLQDQTLAQHKADAERVARLFRTLYELPKPTIAVVQGPAIAGGMGLATTCDFTLAVPGARFGYTEVRIGFVPALVSAFVTLQIGERRARDLLLSGRLIGADEAQRLDLVNEVVAATDVDGSVRSLAETLADNSPEALAATKRLLASQNKQWLDAAISLALEANAAIRETADFREGVSAFLEKRNPRWRNGKPAQPS